MARDIAHRLTKDRLGRLMTINAYAEFLGVSRSTLVGLLAGRKAGALTLARIKSKLSVKAARTT